jgi:hypothetical protein
MERMVAFRYGGADISPSCTLPSLSHHELHNVLRLKETMQTREYDLLKNLAEYC